MALLQYAQTQPTTRDPLPNSEGLPSASGDSSFLLLSSTDNVEDISASLSLPFLSRNAVSDDEDQDDCAAQDFPAKGFAPKPSSPEFEHSSMDLSTFVRSLGRSLSWCSPV
ncbi:hypothetical protein PM082_000725 [Marasmius tenuissimus]|nr:hypothetical protein PM082_000725 [Marasmius tenuissimus]